jgi:hypothetical protein
VRIEADTGVNLILNSVKMANSIGGKDCMVSLSLHPCWPRSLVMWASLILRHELDLRMDLANVCICSCWLESVHSSACAEAKVEVV